jgi:hypothetical protein
MDHWTEDETEDDSEDERLSLKDQLLYSHESDSDSVTEHDLLI